MNPTQAHIPIKEIAQDLVFLKNGQIACVIQTSAVNFGLLSENEQIAIIAAFAGMLNSLSFSIQIYIRSKRLNISSYLEKLDIARSKQTNPLLSQMMLRYRDFVEKTIKENEVLDKQFYVVVPLWSYELGLNASGEEKFKKIQHIMGPRRDHIMRQLAGIGLVTRPMGTKELIKLYYDCYNSGESLEQVELEEEPLPEQKIVLNAPGSAPSSYALGSLASSFVSRIKDIKPPLPSFARKSAPPPPANLPEQTVTTPQPEPTITDPALSDLGASPTPIKFREDIPPLAPVSPFYMTVTEQPQYPPQQPPPISQGMPSQTPIPTPQSQSPIQSNTPTPPLIQFQGQGATPPTPPQPRSINSSTPFILEELEEG